MKQNKKAAMEMSVGTIVTIVLLVSVLVLGLVLISNIFGGATTSVSTIDQKIKSEINNIFKSEGSRIAFFPSDRKITLKQGAVAEGFAFAINNEETVAKKFSYTVGVPEKTYEAIKAKCGATTTLREMESWMQLAAGDIDLPRSSNNAENPELILFDIPKTAPKCTIPYTVRVESEDELYQESKVYVTIK